MSSKDKKKNAEKRVEDATFGMKNKNKVRTLRAGGGGAWPLAC